MYSKICEVYANPIGRDIIRRLLLQINLPACIIENTFTENLSLHTVAKLTQKKLGTGFFNTLIKLLNQETDSPAPADCKVSPAWWKKAVFYQIYPRSFYDTNKDGIGDLKGIISRLDYIRGLGVDAIWLSPIYDSPGDDNGYDIRDYRKIGAEYGTMEEFDTMLREIHRRDMKLIMDLVINHTSDEHEWFQSALKDKNSPYSSYYIFKKGKGKNPPNNWTSFFGGSAWKYYEERDEWALHLFSPKQMDLNWENPGLRNDIINMIRWWLKKGVDGFRMDVINYISKTEGLPDGDEQIGNLMGYTGIEHYFYGPRLHEYLREIHKKAFAPFHAFSVGETPGIGMEMGKLLSGDNRGELDMIFSFDHLETPGHVRFDDYLYDLNYLKKYYMDWTVNYGNHCRLSLFFENHDNPRMLSKVEKNKALHQPLARLLLTLQLTLKGTPFIYQGQELAASNLSFTSIEELKDIESKAMYEEFRKTMTDEKAFLKVLCGSRDHARAMMDWEKAFRCVKNTSSVYHFCRRLALLRRANPAFIYGEIQFVKAKKHNYFAFVRELDGQKWFVECNLSGHRITRPALPGKRKLYCCSYKRRYARHMLPYETAVYRTVNRVPATCVRSVFVKQRRSGSYV